MPLRIALLISIDSICSEVAGITLFPHRNFSQHPQLIINILSRHQSTVSRAWLFKAGGFFRGADHHPKMDTNSTPELAKWLQASEEVFHCCYSKSGDPKYQGVFGLVMGIAPSAGSVRATPHRTPRGKLLFGRGN